MCRHTDGDSVVDLIIFVEFSGYVAFMTIDYQHLIHISKVILCMFIEVLNPVQACLIVDPSITSRLNYPIV